MPTSIRVKVGDEVKGKTVRGYRRVQINKVRYKAHDLAWLYMAGNFPVNLIDHRDCNPDNLRWLNLRDATQMQNCHNKSLSRANTSGFKGVNLHARTGKWHARVGSGNRRIFVGQFETAEAANAAACVARERLHGEFANHGMKSQ